MKAYIFQLILGSMEERSFKPFEGLYYYEWILLILGIPFFLILVYFLIRKIMQNQPVKQLTVYFLISIAMIAYPSIKKIEFEGLKIELWNRATNARNSPTDTVARAEFEESVEQLGSRPLSVQTEIIIAEGYEALDEKQKAMKRVDSILERRPELSRAKDLRRRLGTQ